MATWGIGKTFHVIRGRVVCIIVLSFQSGLTSLYFVDDLCQILNIFHLIVLVCVTKCGPAGILEGNTTDRCIWKPTCSIFMKIWVIFLTTLDEEQAHGATKWIKNNLLMIPPWMIRVKNMLNSIISMSYPDVVIACIEHKVSAKHSEQLRQRWWNTIIIWRIIPWWLTDHHQHLIIQTI